jgi:hypothetical protein
MYGGWWVCFGWVRGFFSLFGRLLSMDIHVESRLLLERLANSVFDRNPSNPNPLFFTTKESHIVEQWIRELLLKQKPLREVD